MQFYLFIFIIQSLKYACTTTWMMYTKKELTSQLKCLIYYLYTYAERQKTKTLSTWSITAWFCNVLFSIKYYSQFSNSLILKAFGSQNLSTFYSGPYITHWKQTNKNPSLPCTPYSTANPAANHRDNYLFLLHTVQKTILILPGN